MAQYYSESLSAERLKTCYDIAPPRILKYLEAEVDFVTSFLAPSQRVLELGCGYGRILSDLTSVTPCVLGIDISIQSLRYNHDTLHRIGGLNLIQMNAVCTGFKADSFDTVVCIQNGISAFKVDPLALLGESLRITKSRGKCLFSTYSEKIWEERLEWFQLQADEGLLGEIDWDNTGDGTIRCKDGFIATTVTKDDFMHFAEKLSVTCEIEEIDSSSLFCILSSP
jgi:2-polyprenyl-6-hydroxyphenyl methylase/3-demethylubiquinone-9 3-methyltransferase